MAQLFFRLPFADPAGQATIAAFNSSLREVLERCIAENGAGLYYDWYEELTDQGPARNLAGQLESGYGDSLGELAVARGAAWVSELMNTVREELERPLLYMPSVPHNWTSRRAEIREFLDALWEERRWPGSYRDHGLQYRGYWTAIPIDRHAYMSRTDMWHEDNFNLSMVGIKDYWGTVRRNIFRPQFVTTEALAVVPTFRGGNE